MSDLDYHDVARIAMAFVLEDESWPVFVAWAKQHFNTERAFAWTQTADLYATRMLFLTHSPDPFWRAVAGADDGV